MIYLLLILFAPAPLPKPETPITTKDLTGKWVLASSSTLFKMTLTEEGIYDSSDGIQTWVGYWKLENNILLIKERHSNSDPFNFNTIIIPLFKERKIISGKGDCYSIYRPK